MVPGERDLARAGEVEVVGGEVVDLVRVLAEESGAGHDLRPHQRRRDQRREARVERALQAELHERELEPRADALEEVRTGRRRPSRRAPCRSRRAVSPIARWSRGSGKSRVERRLLADRLERDEVVLAAGRHAVEDDVLDAADDLA